jgi:hypothetical protein
MYLRLKRRALKKTPTGSIDAVILESKRQSRTTSQRFIAYLGSIKERYVESKVNRILFWDKVAQKLDSLNLPPVTRQRIEERLSQQIPQPTNEERKWYQELRAQREAEWRRKVESGVAGAVNRKHHRKRSQP